MRPAHPPGDVPIAPVKAWLDENEAAIDAYNRRVRQRGLWSDGLRCFELGRRFTPR